MSSDLESRLAAIEAELAVIKAKLGLLSPPPEIRPAATARSHPIASGADGPGQGPGRPPDRFVAPQSSTEVRLASYWVTRIGAILVLLGAIFLAAYHSLHSTPMARIGHLCVLSFVTFGIAYWQQSRANRRFGLVLLSLGDALIFFAAFAAYAFEPTKVVQSVGLAVALQALAAAFVCGHAILRRSEGSATFGLVLFGWVSAFSLSCQQSEASFGFIVAIAVLAAIFRSRLGWRFPLGFAAVCCPLLCYDFVAHFDPLHGAVQATLAALPAGFGLAIASDRSAPMRSDRLHLLLAAIMTLLVTAAVRGLFQPAAFDRQYLWDALGLAVVAGSFLIARSDPSGLRRSIGAQAAFVASIAAALHLSARFENSPFTPVAIVAIGLLSAMGLRRHRRAVPGPWWIAFAGIAILCQVRAFHGEWPVWPAGGLPFTCALLVFALSAMVFQIAMDDLPAPKLALAAGLSALAELLVFHGHVATPTAEVLTLVALAAIAGAAARRWRAAIPWLGAALAMAHVAVFLAYAGDAGAPLWLPTLAVLALADGLLLAFAPPLQQPRLHPAAVVTALVMLVVLDFGYARADLPWSATFAWVPLAGAVFLLGFFKGNPGYRIAALVGFAACLIRLFAEDLHSTFTRISAFFLVGGILLGIGYLYTRLSRRA